MKFAKLIILLLCTQFSFAAVFPVHFPFQNINLNPNDTLVSDYSFGPYSLIFCFENTTAQNVGIFTWPFHGVQQSSTLPVYLKTSAIFEGNFADPNGRITLTNNQSFTMIVSCLPAF